MGVGLLIHIDPYLCKLIVAIQPRRHHMAYLHVVPLFGPPMTCHLLGRMGKRGLVTNFVGSKDQAVRESLGPDDQ